MRPKLSRHDHLFLWAIWAKTPPDHPLDEQAVVNAATHVKLDPARAVELTQDPAIWARVLAKREAKLSGRHLPTQEPDRLLGVRMAHLKRHPQMVKRLRQSGFLP